MRENLWREQLATLFLYLAFHTFQSSSSKSDKSLPQDKKNCQEIFRGFPKF
jgi:hypothetical protein